jgi:hypothetical protein
VALLRARGHQLQKKSLQASEQDRPDVARRRTQWRKYQGRLDPSRLVFIDDTWAKTNMTRTHDRDAPLSAPPPSSSPASPRWPIAAAPPRTVMNSRRRMTSPPDRE